MLELDKKNGADERVLLIKKLTTKSVKNLLMEKFLNIEEKSYERIRKNYLRNTEIVAESKNKTTDTKDTLMKIKAEKLTEIKEKLIKNQK